jgi:hypothetical protein
MRLLTLKRHFSDFTREVDSGGFRTDTTRQRRLTTGQPSGLRKRGTAVLSHGCGTPNLPRHGVERCLLVAA